MVSRLLFLEPGQLKRACPFFAVYLLLFAALTLADGLSLALFVSRLGADQLPRYQALAAGCVMLSVGWYLCAAGRADAHRVFLGILLAPLVLFGLVWAGLVFHVLDSRCLGLLFLGRELAFALVLLHFGAYLQDYFTRAELNRVMPVIYAGGRVGGIAGGALLEHLSCRIETAHLLLVLAGLLAASVLGLALIHRRVARVDDPQDPPAERIEADCQTHTPGGFLRYMWRSRLLFWITASTLALFACRAGLSLQYNRCFQREFADSAELARFLGRYAQFALAASLPFQLFLVSRLVAWLGLRGAQIAYALLIAAAALGGWGQMSLAAAVFARLVETELRYGMRNPLAQMTVNLFPRSIRTRARAWSLGLLIPLATIVASLVLDQLVRGGAFEAITVVTIFAAGAYLAATFGLAAAIDEPSPRRGPAWLTQLRVRWASLFARAPQGQPVT